MQVDGSAVETGGDIRNQKGGKFKFLSSFSKSETDQVAGAV